MLSKLFDFFQKEKIDAWAPIALSSCTLAKPYLLEREGISDGTAVIIAVPYYSHAADSPDRNISAYAVTRDYHAYFKDLLDRLLKELRTAFPDNRFAAFADHSPIDEREAAAKAGLGIFGDNRLLITPKYSSYVFLGELITDAILPYREYPIAYCEHCGACARACPMECISTCLSALTQKKGELTATELEHLATYRTAWGCDICQMACPHTKEAIRSGTVYSPIPYFQTDLTPTLTSQKIREMSDADFAARAYSWRGKDVILRNLEYLENQKKGEPNA